MRQYDNFFLELIYHLLRLVFGPIVRLIWIKNVTGIQNIPSHGPAIIAFNHQSYFDFLCFIAICPRHIHYLSAEKFFSNIFWLPFMKVTGQIKVERHRVDHRPVNNIVLDHLNSGKLIGIFPEGTRASDKNIMLKAFTGVAKYATKAKVPIIPVGIKGSYEIMSRFDKIPKLKKNISINIGSSIKFNTYYDKTKLNKKSFRLLTDKVMNEISKLSGKFYPHSTI